jgi:soluble lytic murein transglycosylase-like protein
MLRCFATATVCAVLTATPPLSNQEFTVATSDHTNGAGAPVASGLNDGTPVASEQNGGASNGAAPSTSSQDDGKNEALAPSAPQPDDAPRNAKVDKPSSVSRLTTTIDPSIAAEMAGASDAKLGVDYEKMPARELTHDAMCLVLREVAAENKLPEALFTRLIWQESKFRKNAVSPVGARGIAQFMPATARERGLDDPFDPLQALPASAEFLRELATQFGNFGLAAAAYNGGPGRVSRWLAGKGGLPKETRDYVIRITGKTAEHWAEDRVEAEAHPEALDVSDCNVRPLRAALADLREEQRLKRDGYPSIELANAANAKKLAKQAAAQQPKPLLPWIAMLTGTWTEKKVHSVYANLKKKYPNVLAGRSPTVRVAHSGGKNKKKSAPKTQVHLTAETREEAQQLCQSLKAFGGACVVKKDGA